MADLFTRAAYALRELRRHGAIRSPWLAGMRLGRVPGTHDRGHWLHVRLGDTFAEPSDGRIWLPDLTDPLTVAALGVLAEEAWAAAGVRVLYLEPDDRLNPGAGWDAYACHDGGRIECVGRGAAKADAWTAALEARVLALGGTL